MESVFTSINGGRPNTDLSVMREDIQALIPAAVNFAITGDYWANIQRDNDREIPNSFVTEFCIKGIECHNDIHYVRFDKKTINIPGNGGIRYVQDAMGNVYSPRALGVSSKGYWDKALAIMPEYQRRGDCIFLYNKPELVDMIFVGSVLSVSELSDDDDLPIPAGMEPQVIDILMNFFVNQRMQPKDYVINGVDPVNEVR